MACGVGLSGYTAGEFEPMKLMAKNQFSCVGYDFVEEVLNGLLADALLLCM